MNNIVTGPKDRSGYSAGSFLKLPGWAQEHSSWVLADGWAWPGEKQQHVFYPSGVISWRLQGGSPTSEWLGPPIAVGTGIGYLREGALSLLAGESSRLSLRPPLLACPRGIRDPHPPEAPLGKNGHGSFRVSGGCCLPGFYLPTPCLWAQVWHDCCKTLVAGDSRCIGLGVRGLSLPTVHWAVAV